MSFCQLVGFAKIVDIRFQNLQRFSVLKSFVPLVPLYHSSFNQHFSRNCRHFQLKTVLYCLYHCTTQISNDIFQKIATVLRFNKFCTICTIVPLKFMATYFRNHKCFWLKKVLYCLYHCTIQNLIQHFSQFAKIFSS